MSMKKLPAKVISSPAKGRQRGITLIELIIFMVIVGVAMAGIISSINFNVQHSADPVVKKQALAIAESLLEEIELMPFTWCDPNDPVVNTANSAAECTTGFAETIGPETIATQTETRGGITFNSLTGNPIDGGAPPFDNVNDYDGYCMATTNCAITSIRDITGAVIPNLTEYTALVVVDPNDLNNILGASGAVLHITVTVTGPLDTTVLLESYRTRYTPQEP